MKEERQLVQKIVDKLDAITADNVRVITSKDQKEQRSDYMVVVGVTDVAPFHSDAPAVPDYNFTVQILIDCYIEEDREGFKHDQVVEAVEGYLEIYLKDQSRLAEIFDDIPIVGMFMLGSRNVSTDESNQTFIQLQVVGSY